jgi:hypothetical protein
MTRIQLDPTNRRNSPWGTPDDFDEVVEDLRREAGQAGDTDTVQLCSRWLAGEATRDDLDALLAILNDAQAQR